MIDLEKMADAHKKLFPNATAESQFYKMEEEIEEYQDACGYEETIKELADIVIVCAGLYRWFPLTATAIAIKYTQPFYEYYKNTENIDDISNEVNRKWQINLKRKWVWNGKTYKHVQGTGE